MAHICTIIPPHILRAVVASTDIDDDSKSCHRYTLHKTANIRTLRQQAAFALFSAQQSQQGEQNQQSQGGHGSSRQHRSIIPPQIHRKLAESSETGEQEAAVSTLDYDTKIRTARQKKPDTPAASGLSRTIYDFKNSDDETKLPGSVVDIKEGGEPVPIAEDKTNDANEAYEGFGDTYNFYKEHFSRNSIDNKGLPLIGTVHFGRKYQNAFWDGKQMVFGDGDGKIFLDFTSRPDVIAHELTHGVTEKSANLNYEAQSGALNESVSDVFGIMVKQWKAGQDTTKANWLIGEGIWGPSIKGRALRDMQNPGTAYDDPKVGKDPQPATMADYQDLPVDDENDYGGVHINSGIPNKAFYEAATRIGGNSWKGAGPIWYKTLTGGELKSDATFQQFADLTYKNAGEYTSQIAAAWQAVGITVSEKSEL